MKEPGIDCNHEKFTEGICDECGWECEHQDIDDDYCCCICGENVPPSDREPDDMYEAHSKAEE